MLYYSTNNRQATTDFRGAAMEGQPADKGLYFPERIPQLSSQLFNNIDRYSRADLAFEVIRPYTGDSLPEDVLQTIVRETVDFEFPLVLVDEDISSLELYHGPTLAFKDVGARFMSRCLGYFARGENRPMTVLVATSGDTGGAVANAFAGVEGVSVIILYPSGKVSHVQELQLTTLGGNIKALEIDGSFDDCQRLVKQAFTDAELNRLYLLTSANSINVARWLPQQFYYFFAWQQWPDKQRPPVISVPSGNFGNLCAGLLAERSGLLVQHFLAACNANDSVPQFLSNGDYHPKKAIPTLSNAMDVGDPSNFVRLLELFGHDLVSIQKILSGYTVTDERTREVIRDLYQQKNYLADPHGAVGYEALRQYLDAHPGNKGFFLETAHPVKFFDVVEPVTGTPVPLPDPVKALLDKKKNAERLPASFDALKQWMK
jgi:threonine synthase